HNTSTSYTLYLHDALPIFIHGGPNGQDEHNFSFERQFFAANGYVVISVNYRGSSGRGSAFQKAIYADWGNKEVIDLLGAVDFMINRKSTRLNYSHGSISYA